MKKKPLIGISPQIAANEPNALRILKEYSECILNAGGIGFVLPVTSDINTIMEISETFDAFLFSGGIDIHPSYYGEPVTPYLKDTSEDRDKLETLLLKELIKLDKPVLGICRGLQIMNVTFGGTLYQDIISQKASSKLHTMDEPFDRPLHNVTILHDTLLHTIVNQDSIGVNSRHHQAIKDIAPDFLPMAISDDGLIEAIYNPDKKFFAAVQWHPENMYNKFEHSRNIFNEFIKACEK